MSNITGDTGDLYVPTESELASICSSALSHWMASHPDELSLYSEDWSRWEGYLFHRAGAVEDWSDKAEFYLAAAVCAAEGNSVPDPNRPSPALALWAFNKACLSSRPAPAEAVRFYSVYFWLAGRNSQTLSGVSSTFENAVRFFLALAGPLAGADWQDPRGEEIPEIIHRLAIHPNPKVLQRLRGLIKTLRHYIPQQFAVWEQKIVESDYFGRPEVRLALVEGSEPLDRGVATLVQQLDEKLAAIVELPELIEQIQLKAAQLATVPIESFHFRSEATRYLLAGLRGDSNVPTTSPVGFDLQAWVEEEAIAEEIFGGVPVPVPASPELARQLFSEGMRLRAQKNLVEAIEKFRQASAVSLRVGSPLSEQLQFLASFLANRAMLLWNRRQWADARRWYLLFFKLVDKSPELLGPGHPLAMVVAGAVKAYLAIAAADVTAGEVPVFVDIGKSMTPSSVLQQLQRAATANPALAARLHALLHDLSTAGPTVKASFLADLVDKSERAS